MKLSFIIPAFNEEKLLPVCLAQVAAAVAANASSAWSAEVIVCDNNSTDRTAELARLAGAHVVFEPINQISRARNAGASVARGDWLLFLDADSILHPATLAELLRTIDRDKCAGGGCVGGLDDGSLSGRAIIAVWNLVSRTLRWAAGSFVFCRTQAFRDIGGFSLALYAAEEIAFSRALKRWARAHDQCVVILQKQPHVTSARKLRLYSRGEMARHVLRCVLPATLRDPGRLALWYDGRR